MPNGGSKRVTRRREIVFPLGKAGSIAKNSHSSGSSSTVIYPPTTFTSKPAVIGSQVTDSEGHPWPPRKGFQGDIGGDFTSTIRRVSGESRVHTFKGSLYSPVFNFYGELISWSRVDVIATSPMYPVDPIIAFNDLSSSHVPNENSLMKAGATAIARCAPNNSVADLSTAIGEILKDGIPRLIGASTWKNRTSRAKQAGGEYLNVEFGWKPLLSDIRKTADAIRKAERILAQYERDAGKVVRRRYAFSSQKSTEVTNLGKRAAFCSLHSVVTDGWTLGDLVRTRETVRDVWFSGAFTYWLPTGSDTRSRMLKDALLADKLFGTIPTPEVIWNLTPWSWAVDWFSNAGDVLSNISGMISDGLVMRYGYIMEHTVIRDTYTLDGFRLPKPNESFRVAPLTVVTETKVRRQANPFGFGLTWNGLSPRQVAIAAALGITRRK